MIQNPGICGCDCFNCPTYRENIKTSQERRNCSAGWEKYLNIKLSPEKLRPCDGCSIPEKERKTFYLNCAVRKCAMVNEIENCAFCAGFPCDELLKIHSIQGISSREEFIRKTHIDISEKDYRFFVEPYTGLQRLNKIRQTLVRKNFKEFKKFSTKEKFSPFGDFNGRREVLQKIYSLLASVCVEKDISFARLLHLQREREQLMKILWAAGCYGTYHWDGDCIELGSKAYLAQKIQGLYPALLECFNELKHHDVHCEIVPLVEKGWLTPMGGLRKEGWALRLKFGSSFKEVYTPRMFLDYVQKLNAKYGNQAFRKFNSADLGVMSN